MVVVDDPGDLVARGLVVELPNGRRLLESVDLHVDAGKLTAVGVIALVASLLITLNSIEATFNRIWRVPTGRPLASRLLMYWAVLTAGPILMVGALAISSYVFALPLLAQAGIVAGDNLPYSGKVLNATMNATRPSIRSGVAATFATIGRSARRARTSASTCSRARIRTPECWSRRPGAARCSRR